MKESPVYLPGLNGLRAIAALLVVISHISIKEIGDFGLPYLIVLPMAGYGVTLFFVISGFLITYLLLQEKELKQTIDIKKFYMRRILRIWPIYYLFLIICVIVFFILGKSKDICIQDMWFYVFFAANIPFVFQQGILILFHYWSIGVEEQFYLIWPWIVKKSKTTLFKTALSIFSILFLLKVVFWLVLGSKSFEYRFINVTRFHCMMIGVMGAIMYFEKQILFLNFFSNTVMQFISLLLFLLLGFQIIHIPALIVNEVIAFVSLSMILGQVTIQNRILNLENKLFDFIGKISYGIYVIHPLIIFLLSRLFINLEISTGIKYFFVYFSVISLTLFFTWISYTYFEIPFLRLKKKFSIIQSSNTMLFSLETKNNPYKK